MPRAQASLLLHHYTARPQPQLQPRPQPHPTRLDTTSPPLCPTPCPLPFLCQVPDMAGKVAASLAYPTPTPFPLPCR